MIHDAWFLVRDSRYVIRDAIKHAPVRGTNNTFAASFMVPPYKLVWPNIFCRRVDRLVRSKPQGYDLSPSIVVCSMSRFLRTNLYLLSRPRLQLEDHNDATATCEPCAPSDREVAIYAHAKSICPPFRNPFPPLRRTLSVAASGAAPQPGPLSLNCDRPLTHREAYRDQV